MNLPKFSLSRLRQTKELRWNNGQEWNMLLDLFTKKLPSATLTGSAQMLVLNSLNNLFKKHKVLAISLN